ncbi:hypothetical protein PHMEG_0004109 [Phytophthora megakarya]|uniref:Neutral zinc metallopeptidase n=1 Tax=Phytophthora megakarya TaxID=4795 RepID=A0A225WW87_9STRA|nr:hypothetical protein PHMEG_0004109 [Phytophthora megakarya]
MAPSLFSSISAVILATAVATVPADAASNSSAAHAPFGTITSKSGECVVGDPNTYITPTDLKWIWDNNMQDVPKYNVWITDQLVANKGTINYCIRWDGDTKLSKEIATKLQPMLARQHAAWNRWLIGYNCWPYDEIKVNVVGVAVKDKTLVELDDDTLGPIYVGDLDKDGSIGCKGKPYHISLWPKQGLDGGWGTYWGQQVNLENMLEHLDDKELKIVSHEMGHGFGLPDFYGEESKPANFKPSIMEAGKSSTVTDSDGWMLRRVLENKKKNYNF